LKAAANYQKSAYVEKNKGGCVSRERLLAKKKIKKIV